jgi:hypothetical protein
MRQESTIFQEDGVMLYRLSYLMLITLLIVPEVTAQTLSHTYHVSKKGQAATSSINTDWHVVTGPDKDFIVKFPSEPEQRTEVDKLGEAMRRYRVTKGSLLFQLMFWDTNFDPTSREGNELSPEFSRDMLAQAKHEGWTVIRAQLLNRNIYEQERWTPMDSDPNHKLHLTVRHVRRYGREYILACSSLIPDKVISPEMCRQFFKSFRVIGKPHPQ